MCPVICSRGLDFYILLSPRMITCLSLEGAHIRMTQQIPWLHTSSPAISGFDSFQKVSIFTNINLGKVNLFLCVCHSICNDSLPEFIILPFEILDVNLIGMVPPPTYAHAMAMDPESGAIYVVGGFDGGIDSHVTRLTLPDDLCALWPGKCHLPGCSYCAVIRAGGASNSTFCYNNARSMPDE